MEDLINNIGTVLRPESLGDLLIYIIAILSIVMLAVTPDKNDMVVYLMFGVILLCMVDILRGDSGDMFPIEGFDNEGFATFLIHIGMAVFPLIAAGMVRRKGRKGGAAVPLGILIGFIGAAYALGSFFAADTFYSAIF